jgi:uncharacterized protein YlzI (FlbEa/FlbD family)
MLYILLNINGIGHELVVVKKITFFEDKPDSFRLTTEFGEDNYIVREKAEEVINLLKRTLEQEKRFLDLSGYNITIDYE